VTVHDFLQAGDEGGKAGIGVHFGGVHQELLSPDEIGLLAQLHHPREEAAEQVQAEALADAGQAGMVRKSLVQIIAQIPAHAEPVGGEFQQLALRAQTIEEQHKLELPGWT
jgi:hypothetical protein